MQNEIEAKQSAEREDQMKALPDPVQEAIDAYGKYYAKHHKLGMSVRDDMTYIAQMAMRWIKPTDATEIEAAADELRWYSKHLGDFNGKPNKPWAEHFNDDINALRDMALMEKARADWLAADGVVVSRNVIAYSCAHEVTGLKPCKQWCGNMTKCVAKLEEK